MTIIKLRRSTSAEWSSANPVLAAGEEGIESDTGQVKYGDGTTSWSTLRYFSPGRSSNVNVCDYGNSVGTGGDDTAAIAAAWAAAQAFASPYVQGRGLYFPAGNYHYNGVGLDPTGTSRINISGAGRGTTTITLGSTSYLVKCSIANVSCAIHDFSLSGGRGLYRQTFTGTNTIYQWVIRDIEAIGFTEAFFQSEAVDEPVIKFERCYVMSADNGLAMGIALGGYADGVEIRDVDFLNVQVAIKARRGGNNLHIQNFSNIHGTVATNPRVDIWLVPETTYVNSGNGTTIIDSKLGNENLVAGDLRILFADELSGTSNGVRMPNLAADSTGWITGVKISGGSWANAGSIVSPLVYSTTHNLMGIEISHFYLAGTNAANVIDLRTPSAVVGDRDLQGNVIGPMFAGTENTEVLSTGISNALSLFSVVDPAGVFTGVGAYSPISGHPADYADLTTQRVPTWGPIGSGSSVVALTDAAGGADAATITLPAGGYAYATLAAFTKDVPIWISIDLKGGVTAPLSQVKVAIQDYASTPVHWQRFAPVQTGRWTTLTGRFTANTSAGSFIVITNPTGATGSVRVGRVRVEQGSAPMALGPGDRHAGGKYQIADYGDLSTPTSSTTTFTAAITACVAGGGGTVQLPTAGISINGPVTIPDGVALTGTNSSVSGHVGSQIRTSGSTARIAFAGYGGVSGNFNIEGSSGGDVNGLLYIDAMDNRYFGPISVNRAPGDGVLIEKCQNSSFDQLGIYYSVRDGLVLDKGCGGLRFSRTELAASGRDNLSIKGNSGLPFGVYDAPTHIKFDVGDIEYANDISGTFRNLIRQVAGDEITFDHFHIGAPSFLAHGSPGGNGTDGYMLHLEGGQTSFRDCSISGNGGASTAGLMYVKNHYLYFNGSNRIFSAPTLFTFDTFVGGRLEQYSVSDYTTEFTLLNGVTALPVPRQNRSSYLNAVSGVFTLDFSSFDHLLGIVSVNSTCTTVPAGRSDGDEVTLGFIRGTAGATIAWPSNVLFTGSAPVLGATVNNFVNVTFRSVGGLWLEKTRSG